MHPYLDRSTTPVRRQHLIDQMLSVASMRGLSVQQDTARISLVDAGRRHALLSVVVADAAEQVVAQERIHGLLRALEDVFDAGRIDSSFFEQLDSLLNQFPRHHITL